MRQVPILPTLLVALAVAAMIALGFWQIARLHQKEALLAQLTANRALPAIAFPRAPDERLLFRRASAVCHAPIAFTREGGHDATGHIGWRIIARCATGVTAQIGVSQQPNGDPPWPGGPVSGPLVHAPSHSPLIAGLFGSAPPPALMIVADRPAPGLAPNATPDMASIPNNHLAYAVQWFLFAAVALVVYAVALRRRWRGDLK